MARALYRTYRSRSLNEVVGQEHITDLLKRALAKGLISHAYLLTGPRGIGKTSVARILAHEINKLPYSDEPNLDIIEIDAASNRRIDDMRDLRDKVRIAPVAATYKVYIIDEVHMLTNESFNALLKTLEEPPEHAVFILATTEAHKVPATILSRTQRFHFRPVEQNQVANHLAEIAAKEHIAVDTEALSLIARHGGGSFRDSISLLDQLSGSGELITTESVEQVLGLVSHESMSKLIDAILAQQTKQMLSLLRDVRNSGAPAALMADQLIRELASRADEQPALYGLLNELLDVPRAHEPYIKLAAVLVRFCEMAPTKDQAIKKTMPATTFTTVISAPVGPVPQDVINSVTKISDDTIIDESKPARNNNFDWAAILAAAKKHNAPLHSVLARARNEYQNETLTLYFMFSLHRKKLEQAQYFAQLTKLITDICGACPKILIKDGRVMDENASTVAAIMGGGEPVSAR